jgi:transposase
VFDASWQTVYRRFAEWSSARVWAKLHRVILDELGARGELDWSRCAIDSVSVRAAEGSLMSFLAVTVSAVSANACSPTSIDA